MMRLVLCVCAGLFVAGLAVKASAAELLNGLSAVVHDSVITLEDVETLNAQTAGDLARQYRDEPEVFRQKLAALRAENLQQLIDRKLILQDFRVSYNIPDAVIDKDVDRMIDSEVRANFRDRRALMKTLQAQGTTYERFRQMKRERFLVEQLRQINVSSEVIVSPYKIEVYYQTNREKFKMEDQVKLRMIVINRKATDPEADKKRAEEILGKIKEGVPFEELAGLYSQGSQKNQGGDWGWVDKSVLRPDLSQAAFSMKAGEVSDIIEAPDAYYLMKVEEVRPTHYKPLKDVRDQIEQALLFEEQNKLEKQWIEKLKKKTFVRIF